MTHTSITDFNALINTQIKGHAQLANQLIHLRHVVDFTANTDLAQPNAVELNAQFIVIEKLIKDVEDLNQCLQAALMDHSFPTISVD